jgi:hypothetical protein
MSSTGISWADILKPEVMGVGIPILAILVGGILGAIAIISKAILGHRERMAMIDRGMHPDLVTGPEDALPELEETSPGRTS